MNTAVPGVSRIPFRRGKTFKVIAICLVVALLASGSYIFIRAKRSQAGKTVAQRTAFVTRGELTESITGSAPIESSNRSVLSPKVTATLEKINCKEGDQVKAGDVLFVLDNTDAQLNIENTQNSIAQMQLSDDNTNKSLNGLTVKAPYSGQVTNINVKEGDTVNKGGPLMTITDNSKLSVTLAFSGSAVKNIKIGQKATVYLQDLMLSVDGKVTYVSSKPYTTASGGELYNVEIDMDNPGSLTEGMKATGEITVGGTVLDSIESDSLAYINKTVIKSDAGGTVTNLKLRENEYVNAGDVLLQLQNDDLVLTASTNNIKMENLKSQLDIQQKQLSYYTITAPYDGTITQLGTANEGDTVKQGETLAIVSDMNHLQFSVDIDELDISKLAVGEKVNITSDAIEETATTPLTGTVTKIAMEGSSSNGVTTYPATIAVDDTSAAKLKTGMNIDAEIIITNKPDVLMVPLEAVTKLGSRSFVYVKSTDGQGSANSGFPNPSDFQNGQNGYSGQGGQNGYSGQNGQNGNFRRRNTSGSAIGSYGDNTSGGAIGGGRGQFGGNTSGGAIGGGRGQFGGNTSGGAIGGGRGQFGNTSGSAIQGNLARSRRANADPYYDGTMMVPVETGISNDSYIEIVGGLTEGQEIVLPKVTASSSSSNRSQGSGNTMRIGGMGGGGGGMFVGGSGGGGGNGRGGYGGG